MSQPGHGEFDPKFIRLLFTDPAQEEIAYRWASRLTRLLGPQALNLRPETTLDEMMEWAVAAQADGMDFVFVFRK
jgi:hypothetical protein